MSGTRFHLAVAVLLSAACSSKEAKSVKAVEEANRSADTGKAAEAVKLYQRAIELNPLNGEAYYRLALVGWNYGAGVRVERNLLRAVELQPSNAKALEMLCELHLMSYRSHNDARWKERYVVDMDQWSAQLLRLDSRSYQALRFRGYVALFRGDYANAARSLGAAVERAANPAQANEVAAAKISAILKQGRVSEAETEAAAYLSQHREAKEVYDTLVQHYRENKQMDAAIEVLRKKAEAIPNDSGALLDLAAAYRTAERPSESEQALDSIRNAPDRLPDAYFVLSDFYIRFGDYDSALRALRAGEAHDPKRRLDYRLRECNLLLRQRRSKEAYELLRSLGNPASASTDQKILRQSLLAQLGFPEGVDSSITELKALGGGVSRDSRIAVALAQAYEKQGKVSDAIAALDEAVFLAPASVDVHLARANFFATQHDYARVRDSAERALALDAQSAEAVLARGTALVHLGQYAVARRDLSTAQKRWPDAPEILHHLALTDLGEGRTLDAEKGLQRAFNAGYKPSLISLSRLYISQQRPHLALALLSRAMASGQNTPEIKMAYARAASASGDHALAISTLRRLSEATPENASVFLELVLAIRRSGDLSGALAAASTASQKHPRNPEVLAQRADLILLTGGSKGEARSVYERLVSERPDHPAAARLICLILDTGGNQAEALRLAQVASRSGSNDPEMLSCVTRAFTVNGLNEQALRLLESAVEKQPGSAALHLQLAQAYLNKGDRLKGRSELELALRSNPSPEQAAQARALLSTMTTASTGASAVNQ